MEELLEASIRKQAVKLLKRHYSEVVREKKYRERFETRTDTPAIVTPLAEPGTWDIAKHFDPRYCLSHSEYLARVIWRKILSGDYAPVPAVHYQIPKDSGGSRDIMVFSIPDAAVATLFHKRITERNINLLSANCYSYRPDRNIFDAVLQIQSAISEQKVYVVQYDFSKYFDSIDQTYIEKIISNRSILLLWRAVRVTDRCVYKSKYSFAENARPNVILPIGDIS